MSSALVARLMKAGKPIPSTAEQIAITTRKQAPRKKKGEPKPEHGRQIFVFTHLQKKNVVYSLSKTLKNNASLRQIPYNGKKTVPAALRKDLWHPVAQISFPEGQGAVGLSAFQKLREYRKRHELEWGHEIRVDEKGEHRSRKDRGYAIADQRANSVADIAEVLARLKLREQEEIEKEKAAAGSIGLVGEGSGQQVEVLWSNLKDAENAATWSENVEHGVWELDPELVPVSEELLAARAAKKEARFAEKAARREAEETKRAQKAQRAKVKQENIEGTVARQIEVVKAKAAKQEAWWADQQVGIDMFHAKIVLGEQEAPPNYKKPLVTEGPLELRSKGWMQDKKYYDEKIAFLEKKLADLKSEAAEKAADKATKGEAQVLSEVNMAARAEWFVQETKRLAQELKLAQEKVHRRSPRKEETPEELRTWAENRKAYLELMERNRQEHNAKIAAGEVAPHPLYKTPTPESEAEVSRRLEEKLAALDADPGFVKRQMHMTQAEKELANAERRVESHKLRMEDFQRKQQETASILAAEEQASSDQDAPETGADAALETDSELPEQTMPPRREE